MATCTRQVTITFDGPLIKFLFDTGHRYSLFICCCKNCVSISADAQFLFVAGYVFHKSCVTSVGGNASGNLVTYLGLIEDQIVTACVKGAPFDEDYQDVLDEGTAQGFTLPSAPQQILQNALMVTLKADGIFANEDIIYVMATDGDDDFATLNWVNPLTFQAVQVNAPVFTADQGFAGDGLTQYLDTTWDATNDGVNYTRNAASQAVWIRISGTATNIAFGQRDTGGDAAYLADIGAANSRSVINGSEASALNSAIATGMLHGNRSGAALHQQILNGAAPISNALASTALNTSDFFILAGSDAGVPQFFHDGQVSFAAAGGDLLAEANDFFNAFNTYIAAI